MPSSWTRSGAGHAIEIEREALRKEKDKASAERLAKLEKELADLKEEQAWLPTGSRRRRRSSRRPSQEQLDGVKQEVERAQRQLREGF
jgi:ATP-dependent Clp protease ATP-binding subunit ClpB